MRNPTGRPWLIGALLCLACGLAQAVGLRGEYGFLTDFRCQSDAEARARVRTMAREFGIREFQFYDWFADYSTPTRGARWPDPFRRRRDICRATLSAYIDEIHRQGGRAWAYVQAVGAEETTWANPAQRIYPLLRNGRWHWHVGRFPCYFLNDAWARHMSERWAPEIRQLGFDGIHWDTLGALASDRSAETAGTHDFLRTTQAELRRYGLAQTLNFVDLAWWEVGMVLETVEFPYAEVWSTGAEQAYYRAMARPDLLRRGGVMAFYPSVARPAGWSEPRVLVARHHEAARHGLVYVAIGDGERRVVHEYWPDTKPLTVEERRALAVAPAAPPVRKPLPPAKGKKHR